MPRCQTCDHENRDGARFCEACGAPLESATATGEQRKTVTVLFSDVTGSTALGERLDPESLRGVMARYFELARTIVERHGGSVEKFIGDAVMAVFGIPVLHEDDALRAARAACELRDGLDELNEELERDYGTRLEIRIGVNTGEVVTGTAERLATGDAVNVTARLEQAARPGEILIGAETWDLVGDFAVTESVEPLQMKGKAAPVPAYRLVSVSARSPSRRLAGTMVGRERELGRLRDAMSQAVADGSCQLFTILGAAGVGKSRLSQEFLNGLDGAVVASGGCLSYGEGITYWPIVELLKQLLGNDPDEKMAGLGLDASSIRAIHAVLGDGPIVTSVDEIASAVRRLLEAVASDAPLVVVLDDIHWGEDVFLNLVDHIADLSRDAPILLLCMARPELLDRRPSWGGGKLNATAVLLEPLGASDADALVAGLLDGTATDDALRARILEAAEGNPLFVEEMVALVRDSKDGDVAVPPTIQALLAARLDQLDPIERAVLERGSVEGRVFHRGAVQALSPAESQLVGSFTALVRRELLRPDRPQFPGEDAYRFRHLLIRDAAYDALPKSIRAHLHERFADWIDERGVDLVEVDEIVGYHLERAYGYRAELGPVGEAGRQLGTRAAVRLHAAGTKANGRGDARAATNLLGRAVALFPPDDARRLAILPSLGRALNDAGQWDRAELVLTEAIDTAHATGERGVAADAAVARTDLRIHRNATTTHQQVRAELAEAVSVFEELGYEAGLARALTLAGQLRFWSGESAAAIDDLEQAANHARAAGDRFQELFSLGYVAIASMNGPEPVATALERNEQLRLRVGGASTRIDVTIMRSRAHLEATQGRFDAARDLVRASLALATELGLEVAVTGVLFEAGEIELLAGDPKAAEGFLRPAVERLQHLGDWGHFVTIAPVLAESLLAQDNDDAAEALIELVEEWAIEDDLDPQISMRRVRSRILARRSEFDDAERLARAAVELAEGTDFLDAHARTLESLADVLLLAGRPDDATAELERAIALHEQKGNIVGAARATAVLQGASTTRSRDLDII